MQVSFHIFVVMLTLARSFTFNSKSARAASRSFSLGITPPTATYLDSDRLSITVTASSELTFKGDLLVVPFYKPKVDKSDIKDDKILLAELKKNIPEGLSADVMKIIEDLLSEGVFKADVMSKQVVRLPSVSAATYIALVGLGPNPKKGGATDLEISSASRLGKTVTQIAKDVKAGQVGVVLPTGTGNAGVTQLLLGVHDASYLDNRYRKVPEGGFKKNPLTSVTLLGTSPSVATDIGVNYKLTEMIASGVNFAKDLVSAPSNSKTPLIIGDLCRQMASQHNLECKILGQEECEALGMGAYLGVQQGSMFPPQFIHMTYKPENPVGDVVKVALVGKGLTFDSGGYNLKVGAGSMIELMKFDMGGCAAVLGTAKAISQLRPKNVEVHFITAVCENMVSAEAMRPGDILVASNGKTIEVMNTDAEGRLTLADALVYADNLKVDTIIDLATLTGACIVALGEKLGALYSADDTLRHGIEAAARRTDEGIWALPLESQYKDMVKGTLADLRNIGGKGGGSITAALFLQEFVEHAKWAHIDMAGPVWDTSKSVPTGYGVKFLTDYLINLKK
jgi:leucyl aminopeptidase